jgi:hypothetical protein
LRRSAASVANVQAAILWARRTCILQVSRAPKGKSAPRLHGTPGAYVPAVMKDIVFVTVTVAFFWVSWLYAKSFDRL